MTYILYSLTGGNDRICIIPDIWYIRSKTVDLVKSLVEAEKKDANYDDIDVYAFFNS